MRFVYFYLIIFFFISCNEDPINEFKIENYSISEYDLNSNKQQFVYQDLKYGSHIQQKFDIYQPENNYTTNSKVIILIHGGGWRNGDKSNMMSLVSIIQDLNTNHTIVNMNYRLADNQNFAFPNQFNDIELLISHLAEERENYNIIPEFALIGRSAGGHLALMYDSVYDSHDKVKMVCALAGPSNFSIPFYTENPDYDYLFDLLIDENYYHYHPKILKSLSPYYQASINNSPTLLFHGLYDEIVPIENSIELNEKLLDKNIPSKLFKLNDGHASWGQESMEIVKLNLHKFINEFL